MDLSYKEAKTKAETIRGVVADGKDPVADEQAARERELLARCHGPRLVRLFRRSSWDEARPQDGFRHKETHGVLPRSFLDEPAENVTPAMFRKLISDRTKAPVMRNRPLSRLKAPVRFARSESYIGRLPAIVEMKKPHIERQRRQ